MTKRSWILALCAFTGCYEGLDDGREIGPADRTANVGSCEELGYWGECVNQVGIWWENGSCRVRDCASEGKTCGLISDTVGWGCLEGTAGSTVFDCSELDYAGACLSDDVLVWTEDATCRWADCRARGQVCAWTDTVGYDCVDSGDPPPSGGVLTVSEIVGSEYWVSQDYGPADYDYGYAYCHEYGDWGGQVVHCGVDIHIPHGTPLRVPANGTVLIAGESQYYEDEYNLAAGELKIRMHHDGADVILGHMTQIDLWTGQEVSAGQSAGLSGTANGPHVHIEVRVPDGSTPSGQRTVDPMTYFGW